MPDRAGPPVILTSDPTLRADLERLCAAAGVVPEVYADPDAARRRWAGAGCVVVGADLADAVAAAGLDRRADIALASLPPESTELWRRGLAIGAEHVVLLPDAGTWLLSWLVDSGERGAGRALVVGFLAGRGGAGASTLATALGTTAAELGWETLLVDADPLGGGIDLVAGCEHVPGFRWGEIARAGGRISAPALRSALPRVGNLAVLSAERGLPLAADVPDLLRAARRGNDLVVADLPRCCPADLRLLVGAVDVVVVTTTAEVRAASSARQTADLVGRWCADVRVAVRVAPRSLLPPEDVAATVGVPFAAAVTTRRSVRRAIDEGLGPTLSGRDRRPLRALLDTLPLRALGDADG